MKSSKSDLFTKKHSLSGKKAQKTDFIFPLTQTPNTDRLILELSRITTLPLLPF
ncbi:hypothetical protein [Rippkaea orientalis]|uniref:hypothetical protein n=1 Tax=Rippkaea orientalis TaxID=2546366 RepID=UPI0002D5FC80|nr:hypothetical protein [Rippkaea orientalis]